MKTGKRTAWALMAGLVLAAHVAWAGNLTPPGAPAPTMKTLTELYETLTNSLAEVQATKAEVLASQQRLADLEARFSADGKHVAIGGMVLIPAGSFVMGAATNVGQDVSSYEVPQHTVYVSAFYMDKYEVTSNLWAEVYAWAMSRGYSFGTGWRAKGADHPVHSVDWYDAITWCNARSQMDGLTPCYTNANGTVYTNATVNSFAGGCNWAADGYRLPTEAEWEKAARGGVPNRRFPWDDANTIRHARANYYASPANYAYDVNPTTGYHISHSTGGVPYTSPVGSFAPNGYGLYDMAGNVYEWCWDWQASNYYSISPSDDPRGPSSGTARVLRGGGWYYYAVTSQVAARHGDVPVKEYDYVGFRCVRKR